MGLLWGPSGRSLICLIMLFNCKADSEVGMNCLGEFSTAYRNYIILLVPDGIRFFHHVVKTSVMHAHHFSILQLSIIQVPLNMKWCLHINYTLNYWHPRVICVKIVRGIQNQVSHVLSRLHMQGTRFLQLVFF